MRFALLCLNIIISLSLNTPSSLCLRLITLSVITGTIISSLKSRWLFLSLILVFLGGIIVVFAYVAALTRNALPRFLQVNYSHLIKSIFISIVLILLIPSPKFSQGAIREILITPKTPVIIILMILLLSVLFIRVKNIQGFKGAIKSYI